MDKNYEYLLEIDTTPSGAQRTYASVHEGFSNLTPALNEVLEQLSYAGDNGWGRTEVVGAQLTLALTGKRVQGDTAQDYIFSSDVQFAFGDARKTTLRLTEPGGRQITWPVTLANITPGGGNFQNGSDVAVNIHSNGVPSVIEGGSVLGLLTVVSVAGSSAGDTAVYVNPALTAGNSYKYKTGAALSLPAYGDTLTTGWTAWNGTDEIAATTGDDIVIAEVDGSNLAKKGGKATVTSASA